MVWIEMGQNRQKRKNDNVYNFDHFGAPKSPKRRQFFALKDFRGYSIYYSFTITILAVFMVGDFKTFIFLVRGPSLLPYYDLYHYSVWKFLFQNKYVYFRFDDGPILTG